MSLNIPLVSRHPDGILQVIIPGRISTPEQDVQSIDSTHLEAETWLGQNYHSAVQVQRLGEQASGWLADRATMREVERRVEAGEVDLVLVTEIREIYRNPAFHWRFAQLCVDHDVRFISIADVIDTADETWEVNMHVASLRAGMAVPEVRRRVRRKATFAFSRGGMVLKVLFGYRKLSEEEAESGEFGPPGLRIARIPGYRKTIQEIKSRLLRGDSYEQIADWLNDEQVPPGPYVTSGRWSGRLVRDLMENPILSGRRQFRATVHKLIYRTGKHRSLPNPQPPEMIEYPDLAFLTVEEHDEILPIIARRRREAAAGQRTGRENPLYNRPRARSPWPGQQARCAVCGGLMYRLGTFLRCVNTLPKGPGTCWNHVQVGYDQIFDKVLPWIWGILDQHPGKRATFARAAWQEFSQTLRRQQRQGDDLDKLIPQLEREAQKLAKALRRAEESDALVAELQAVEADLKSAREQRQRLTEDEGDTGCASFEEFSAHLDQALRRMAEQSLDFADLLRRMLPVFTIHPVQALDCGQMRPRARLTLRLNDWTPDGQPVLEVSTQIDLFNRPDHVAALERCVEAKRLEPTLTLKRLGAKLGLNYMTVKRALDYGRRMQAKGLSDPYRELHAPPANASRWGKLQPRQPGPEQED